MNGFLPWSLEFIGAESPIFSRFAQITSVVIVREWTKSSNNFSYWAVRRSWRLLPNNRQEPVIMHVFDLLIMSLKNLKLQNSNFSRASRALFLLLIRALPIIGTLTIFLFILLLLNRTDKMSRFRETLRCHLQDMCWVLNKVWTSTPYVTESSALIVWNCKFINIYIYYYNHDNIKRC